MTPGTSLHGYSVLLLAVASLAGLSASPLAPQQQLPPKFRIGVEITPVDVTVLDEQRRPVRGLTANDFIVRVDGKVQKIAAFSEIEIPTANMTPAAWTHEAARDVESNDLQDPRLWIIVMDDKIARLNDFAIRNTGRTIAHKIVDTMGPRDMAAVIFERKNEESQDLTNDKVALRRAIEEYQPDNATGPILDTVRITRQFLQEKLPGHRRAIVYITAGFDVDDFELFWTLGSSLEAPDAPGDSTVSAAANASRASHVPIYLFNAEGLVAQGPRDTLGGHSALSRVSTKSEDLRTLARGSGGRAIVETNAPQLAVSEMFDEQGVYYQIAYEHTYPLDGRYRQLQIEVKRPNSTVLPESLMFRAPDPTKRAARAKLTAGRTSGLTAALSGAIPSGAVPLRLSTVPVAAADPRSATASVAMTLAVTLPPQQEPSAQRLDVKTLVFDGAGRRELMKQDHVVSIGAGAGREAEVMSRLDLKPGRYNVRIAVTRASDGKSGSIYTTFTVPDFQGDSLSLSGVAIGRAGGAAIAGREALADVLPFAPTSSREFASGDKVGALMRIHQSSKRPARLVSVVTRVVDENGKELLERSAKYEAAGFDGGRGVEHRFELPLTTLAAGDYLLTFLATTGEGGAQAQREVRFSVR